MNRRIAAAILLALCGVAHAEEDPRVSIPDLLQPESRLRAFQQYRIAAKPKEAKEYGWSDLAEFARRHHVITVSEIARRSESPKYLVTWRPSDGDDEWTAIDAAAGRLPSAPAVLLPRDLLNYEIFTADGAPVPDEGVVLFEDDGSVKRPDKLIYSGVIADLTGEGALEVVEREVISTSGKDSPAVHDTDADKQLVANYLVVQAPKGNYLVEQALKGNAEPILAILYNTHPPDRAVGNTWGFQLRQSSNGLYAIELGPVLAPDGVKPEVEFRWDANAGKWSGPEAKPGDHFRVITGSDPAVEAERILRSGGLGYALAPAPEAPKFPSAILDPLVSVHSTPLDVLSKPYVRQSQSALSNEELLTFMGERRTVWDYVHDQMREATSVSDFWTLDPAAAALAYVQRNRPPPTYSRHLISILNPANEPAPEEGDLTLSDGGAFLHHLHCAREGSYLAYFAMAAGGSVADFAAGDPQIDFRKADLSYEEARHLLQTVWWLSRIRSRQLSPGSEFFSGGSTADGWATVQLASGTGKLLIEGFRAASYPPGYMGVSIFSESYDHSAFLNLVVQLFRREAADRLAARWRGRSKPANEASPAELALGQEFAATYLRLLNEGRVPAAPLLSVADAVGEMGWRDLQPQLVELAKSLPPLTQFEKQIQQINAQLKRLEQKLGPEAGEAGFHSRRGRTRPLPGLDTGVGRTVKPLTAREKARFGEVDALFEERTRTEIEAPAAEREIAFLRKGLPRALRKLDLFDKPDALFRSALEE